MRGWGTVERSVGVKGGKERGGCGEARGKV